MENIDIAATAELILGIVILYFIVKSLLKSRSEKNVIGHIEVTAPYKVETPVAPVVEETPAPVVTEAPKTRARKDAGEKKPAAKKPAAKKAPAKKKAA
jgi:hypothetical protein